MVKTLLLVQYRLRYGGESDGSDDATINGVTAQGLRVHFGSLNSHMLGKVLDYLVQCSDYTDGVMSKPGVQQLVVQVTG